MKRSDLKPLGQCAWEIPRRGDMRVPGRIYASTAMLEQILADDAPQQVINVATLPGIVSASLALPDIHWGYGFPIGGVAAFAGEEGIVSPGGVGYDINCGVRLLTAALDRAALGSRVRDLVAAIFAAVPSGVGGSGKIRLSRAELRTVADQGAGWAVTRGYGTETDIAHIEEGGSMTGADPGAVSERAWSRAGDQIGTLGSGNHFVEVGYVSEVYDAATARAFGLVPDQVTVMVHSGSRGFGHQICDDYLSTMGRTAAKYGIKLPDRQLACVPLSSPEGRRYLGAMRAAVNYAFANRQVLAHLVRGVFAEVLGPRAALRTVYEVAHNIARFETHIVGGCSRRLCVHRKGATRAFAPGHPAVPAAYRHVGQPVLVPGDMGRCSYVLVGTEKAMQATFGSACHGAGRVLSRRQATQAARGRDIVQELARDGVTLRARSGRTVGEEMPDAYKDVTAVVDACAAAGIARKVAQLRPLGCVKG